MFSIEPYIHLKERYRENIEKMRRRLEPYNIILERQYKKDKPPNSTTKPKNFLVSKEREIQGKDGEDEKETRTL